MIDRQHAASSGRVTSFRALIFSGLLLLAGPSHAGLLGYYSFDDVGAPLADSSGNGNDLSIGGGTNPIWGSTDGFNNSGAYDFSSDRLIAPINVTPSSHPSLTMGAWVRTDSLATGLRKIMGHDNGGWDRTIGLDDRWLPGSPYSDQTGINYLRYTSFTGNADPLTAFAELNSNGNPAGNPGPLSAKPISTNDWTFIATTYDQGTGTVTMYLDRDAATIADPLYVLSESGHTFGTGFSTFAIGGIRPDNTSEAWDGAIDNVFLYDEVLDLAALTTLRDNGGIPSLLNPEIHTFTATPGHINPGGSTSLSWVVSSAESVAIDMAAPSISGDTGSTLVSPATTTTYTLTASNNGGANIVTSQVTVGVGGTVLGPYLTEFMASNSGTIDDGDGNSSDWIEIHNPNAFPVELFNYSLQDSTTTWTFPDLQIAGNARMIVFASGQPTPNYIDPAGYLHTTFKLSAGGENLFFKHSNGTTLSSFTALPAQQSDASWGSAIDTGAPGFLLSPTPGSANTATTDGFVDDTKFDLNRGFFTAPITVNLTTTTPGASIAYTTDGSEPSATHGTIVGPPSPSQAPVAPVSLTTTTTLRAVAFRSGWTPSNVDTHTYLYLDDVIHQSATPAGFPTTWGEFSAWDPGLPTDPGDPVPADYEMNPVIIAPDTAGMISALQALPTISLVGEVDDFFSADGILSNPFATVDGTGSFTPPFEPDRQISMEWIQPDGLLESQLNCGVRLIGGWSRHYEATGKKSLRLLFKSEFGKSKWKFPLFGENEIGKFDKINLRATFSDGWVDNAAPAQFLRDPFIRESFLAMDQDASRGNFVHLYINGLYWGIFNPTERPDADYAASHHPGNKGDFDALKHAGLIDATAAATDAYEVLDGTSARWDTALALSHSNMSDPANYAQLQEYVDLESLADYCLLNMWCANQDWPHKNWYAFGRRDGSDGGFKFVPWDSEYTMFDLNRDKTGVNANNTPVRFYDAARDSAEFRLLFADRIHKHTFNDGPLTEMAMDSRYSSMAAWIEPSIDLEAARWGDTPYTRQGIKDFRKSHWITSRNNVLNSFIPNRPAIALAQFRSAGLYPSTSAQTPELNQHGGALSTGFPLTLTSPSSGTIYYTTDGSDPRIPVTVDSGASGNTPDPAAFIYSDFFALSSSSVVKARLLSTGGVWSALNEAFFTVDALPASQSNLVVSKIHYNPAEPTIDELNAGFTQGNDFEFIELLNHGTQTLSLAGVSFSGAIDFTFPPGTPADLIPGARVILAGNTAAFEERYPATQTVAGQFTRNLDNDGEEIILWDEFGAKIWQFTYNDAQPWPQSPDGLGPSLVLVNPLSPPNEAGLSLPQNWRASTTADGSPGLDESTSLATWLTSQPDPDPLADPDGDGINQLIAFTTGALTTLPATPFLPAISLQDFNAGGMIESYATLSVHLLNGASGITPSLIQSTDLITWSPADLVLLRTTDNGDGTLTRLYRTASPIAPLTNPELFFSLSVSLTP